MALFGGPRELTEKERVMQNIKQVENEIQQKIFQLGNMYYEEYKNREDAPKQYADMVSLLVKLEENRKGFYKNKLRLEGLMMCESCGASIPFGSMYCNVCGNRADVKGDVEVKTPMGRVCPKCGTAVEEEAMFCVNCGTKMGA